MSSAFVTLTVLVAACGLSSAALVAAPAAAYVNAAPYNVPPFAASVDVVNRGFAAPYVAAPYYSSAAAPYYSAAATPYYSAAAAPYYSVAAAPYVASPYLASPYVAPYAAAAAPVVAPARYSAAALPAVVPAPAVVAARK